MPGKPVPGKPVPEQPVSERPVADPVAMAVFSNRLLSITGEMGHTLVRSSFSPNIKERKDCSVALFDGRGRLVAQASHVPLHLASLMGSVAAVMRYGEAHGIAPGDSFLCNDPYETGGTHTPDISVVTPVFAEGRVVFVAASVGHHSDVGGRVPGSIAGDNRTIFEEGLRLPVMRLARDRVASTDVLNLVGLNSRSRMERILDLRVQLAANLRGERLLRQLLARMGRDRVLTAVDDLLAYTARRLAGRLAAIPDGTGHGTAWLDDDGLGGDPVAIRVAAEIRAGRLVIDFAGTGPAAGGGMNVPRSALEATVYYCVKTMLDPELLPNSGLFAGIDIRARPGSLVNPLPPAAVGARSITCNRVARAVLEALGRLLPPERAMAAGHDIVPAMVFSGPGRGGDDHFVYVETVGGGAGARAGSDGMDGIQVHMTNTSNLPVEAMENDYGLRVVDYALVPDSGGDGTWRGGLGLAREIMAVGEGIVFTARSDGHREGAPGILGGRPGRPATLGHRDARGVRTALPAMVAQLPLQPGESVRIETPGGGGYGNPEQRTRAARLDDLRNGKVSADRDVASG